MSKTLHNPAYYSENDLGYAPVALMPVAENLSEQTTANVVEQPIAQATTSQTTLDQMSVDQTLVPQTSAQQLAMPTIKPTTPSPANMAKNTVVAKPLTAFFQIVAVGVSLFLMGAVAIFVYFGAHPVLYKSNGMDAFELKRVLVDEPQVAASVTKTAIELVTDTTAAVSTVNDVKSNAIDDYILSIQPKLTAPLDIVLAPNEPINIETIKNDTVKSDFKNEATQAKNITRDEKVDAGTNAVKIADKPAEKVAEKSGETTKETTKETQLNKNNNILVKLVVGIAEHGVKESICDTAMRTLNQCH